MKLWEFGARWGDSNCASSLAELYHEGRGGVDQDYSKAAWLYRKAVDGGNLAAMYNLGLLYHQGLGVDLDVVKAAELWQRAVDGGHAMSAKCLGNLYTEGGGGVSINYSKAVKLLRIAVDGGEVRAAGDLGFLYGRGLGVGQDQVEAQTLYHIAADGGDIRAAFSLGTVYYSGNVVKKDLAKALKYFHLASDGGEMVSAGHLGVIYVEGRSGVKVDFGKAAVQYQRISDDGDAFGVQRLAAIGTWFGCGSDVEADVAKGARLILLAASYDVPFDKNVADSVIETAMYLAGLIGNGAGVPRDMDTATQLLELATELGSTEAASSLGIVARLYARGVSVPQDVPRAMKLLRRAAAGGHVASASLLSTLFSNS